MRKFLKSLWRNSVKLRHFISVAIGLAVVWYFGYHVEGEKLTTCIVLSFLIVFGQMTSLAQSYIGILFASLEEMFHIQKQQIDFLRAKMGYPTSSQENNVKGTTGKPGDETKKG